MGSDTKLIVNPEVQIASLYKAGELVKEYLISTAKAGLGCKENSGKTPYGNFKISKKFGEGADVGAVFRSRELTGEVWNSDPENPLNHGEDAKRNFVLTRLIWLSGLDKENSNTLRRYIYMHGTRFEENLGAPRSAGCVCFKNADIIDLFNRISEGDSVEIINAPYNPEKAKSEQLLKSL